MIGGRGRVLVVHSRYESKPGEDEGMKKDEDSPDDDDALTAKHHFAHRK